VEISTCWNAKITDVEAARIAEASGISHLGVATGPLLFADPFQYLALASQVTSTLRLGTMVLDPLTRTAPSVANSLATLNALAPGRVYCGLGAGNNALHSLGHKSATPEEFAAAVKTIRALVAGERAEYEWRGLTTEIKLLSVDDGRMRVDKRVPIHVAGGGPKAMRNAAIYADALVYCVGPNADFIRLVRAELDRLVEEAGRPPGSVKLIGQTWFYENQPGGTWEDALTNGFGMTAPIASVITNMGFLKVHREEIGPGIVDLSIGATRGLMARPEDVGADDRLDQWKNYGKGTEERNAQYMSKALIDFWCLYGQPAQIRENAEMMLEAGLDGFCLTLYNTDHIHSDLQAIGRVLLS
jgi:hypothetical protein